MRRAILSFELPEDENEYMACNYGTFFGAIIHQIREGMIRELKCDLAPDTERVVRQVLDMTLEADLDCIP